MAHIFTRAAVLLICGTAFGLLTSCSVLPVNEEQTGNGPATRENLEERLDSINRQIREDSADASLYLEKGRILNRLAHHVDTARSRTPYYESLHRALEKADSIYAARQDAEGASKVDQLLQVSWSNEHNEGVKILQSDSTLHRNKLEKAGTHFLNAITIIPDSTISYKMKSRAHYRNQEPERAISTLEQARKRVDRLPSEILEQLAFLYLETNQPQKAVKAYQQAESFSRDNLNLLHGLANAYILADEHREATELLGILVDNEPENVIYRQAYGNELYYMGKSRLDSLLAAGGMTREQFEQAESLFERAGNNLDKALSLNPDNAGIKQNLAFYHHNYATQLQRLNAAETSVDSALIRDKVETQLNRAIPLLEELARREPDNLQYWKSLYQAYSYLGLREKAEEAKSNLNI